MISIDSWKASAADVELLQRCKKAIRQAVPDADVVLYGSRARGDVHVESALGTDGGGRDVVPYAIPESRIEGTPDGEHGVDETTT